MLFIPMGTFGTWQIVVIVLLVVLLFGARKIPELMRNAGRGVKEFKDGMNGTAPKDDADKDGSAKEEKKPEEK